MKGEVRILQPCPKKLDLFLTPEKKKDEVVKSLLSFLKVTTTLSRERDVVESRTKSPIRDLLIILMCRLWRTALILSLKVSTHKPERGQIHWAIYLLCAVQWNGQNENHVRAESQLRKKAERNNEVPPQTAAKLEGLSLPVSTPLDLQEASQPRDFCCFHRNYICVNELYYRGMILLQN